MDAEQQALRELDRANRADRLLKDELLRETLDGLRAAWRHQWEATQANDAEGREEIYLALRILNLVEKSLEEHLTTGKMAQETLEKIRAAQQPRHRGPGE